MTKNQLYKEALKTHKTGNFEKAIELFQKAVSQDPENGLIRYNFANVLADAEKLKLAINQYQKALEIEEKPSIYYNLGNCFLDLGKLEEAINCYNNALRLNPNYNNAKFNKAIIFSQLEREDEAVKLYLDIVNDDDEYHVAWYNLACTSAKHGEIDNCMMYLRKAFQTQIDIDYREITGYDEDFNRVRHLKKFRILMGNLS